MRRRGVMSACDVLRGSVELVVRVEPIPVDLTRLLVRWAPAARLAHVPNPLSFRWVGTM